MRRLLAIFLAAVLSISAAPAFGQTYDVEKYFVLLGFKNSDLALTSSQKSKVTSELRKYSKSQEVFCVGLVHSGSKSDQDVALAEERAKETCAFVLSKNKKLTTHYFTTTTKLASEKNQVEVQFRWNTKPFPKGALAPTEAIAWDINPLYTEGKPCDVKFSWQTLGFDKSGKPAYVKCSAWNNGIYIVDRNMPPISSKTMKPLVPKAVPAKSLMGYSLGMYIKPTISKAKPRTKLSPGAFDDYAQCKIAEVEDGTSTKTYGFPLPEYRAVLKENFKILVLPIQFTDHQATTRPADDLADVVDTMNKFYTRASSIPISFDWTIPEEYIQLGRSIESFDLGYSFDGSVGAWGPSYNAFVQFVIDFVDPQFDFSAYDAVIIEEPRSVTDDEHGMYLPNAAPSPDGFGVTQSDEGAVMNLLVTGGDEIRNLPNWIHEFGHLLGLGDRNWQVKSYPAFDIMFGSYFHPELSVWNRWLLGILQDKQVDCKTDKQKSTHLISPVAWVGDYQKAVVIPVSKSVVLVAESRRRQGFDVLLGKESEGVYVYRIDTSAKMYAPDKKKIVDVVRPKRSKTLGTFAFDATLKRGESVASDGWTIKVVETGAFGDVIEVSKKG